MDLFRLATGVIGMLTGIVLAGYTLGWMVRRAAQLVAGTVAVAAGGLLFLIGATTVAEELRDNQELSKAMKSAMKTAEKRVNREHLSRTMKSARQRRDHLQREASKLWG